MKALEICSQRWLLRCLIPTLLDFIWKWHQPTLIWFESFKEMITFLLMIVICRAAYFKCFQLFQQARNFYKLSQKSDVRSYQYVPSSAFLKMKWVGNTFFDQTGKKDRRCFSKPVYELLTAHMLLPFFYNVAGATKQKKSFFFVSLLVWKSL